MTFAILNLLPGNVATAILGPYATPQSIRILNQQLGLNQPFLVRYGQWLREFFHGSLGSSLETHQSVISILAQRAPVTGELILVAMCIALVVAIPLAVLSAKNAGGFADRLSTLLSMIGVSVPGFVIGLALILVVAEKSKIFPA